LTPSCGARVSTPTEPNVSRRAEATDRVAGHAEPAMRDELLSLATEWLDMAREFEREAAEY
jgi:hypothetical protein